MFESPSLPSKAIGILHAQALEPYTGRKATREDLTRAMDKQKNLVSQAGKVNRLVKIPPTIHQKIKEIAQQRGLRVYELYSQIVSDFLNETKKSSMTVEYLVHQFDAKNQTIKLKEHILADIKERVLRDAVSENRIMFTAIMKFARKNSLIT